MTAARLWKIDRADGGASVADDYPTALRILEHYRLATLTDPDGSLVAVTDKDKTVGIVRPWLIPPETRA